MQLRGTDLYPSNTQIASLRETIRSLQERLDKLEDEYKEASQQAAQSAQQLGMLRLMSSRRQERVLTGFLVGLFSGRT